MVNTAKVIGQYQYRLAQKDDLSALVALENKCFAYDKLSQRSLRHWITAKHGILLVVEDVNFDVDVDVDVDVDKKTTHANTNKQLNSLLGYGLVWRYNGTKVARLYSLAVDANYRGQNIASEILTQLEVETVRYGHSLLRLEVSQKNSKAISLYERLNYRVFGEYSDYYEDGSDAYRMQKALL
ncbi:N-acetyltransferase [Colwellia sp. E2M01]|uniref:GNAT family N-acetyltransferase n=1 Tax=Colwellia sp. E2M01 TaxID=2841561 RepID=UPI001C09924B|nr:N-acetyltransferase [Colwellia sp. E2M01]MBU2871542.1 GNAT family N-acetyltransferase [Colwellia sp. E2M01]